MVFKSLSEWVHTLVKNVHQWWLSIFDDFAQGIKSHLQSLGGFSHLQKKGHKLNPSVWEAPYTYIVLFDKWGVGTNFKWQSTKLVFIDGL